MNNKPEESSFKDQDSVVFENNGEIFRNIFYSYKDNYDKLMYSGLYKSLIQKNLIIPHKEIESKENNIYKVIKPEKIFITYPWEWPFSQLKDAAIATLKIQLEALNYGMSLKDANCYNIQFKNNKALLIDTTSFEEYQENKPWVAYRQFCENFLVTLALMAYTDIRLQKLLLTNINGIPLDLAVNLLPQKSFLNLNIFLHIALHSKFQNKYAGDNNKKINVNITKQSQINLIKNLLNAIENLKLKNFNTEWNNYYSFTNYDNKSFEQKKQIIKDYKERINPVGVWDFGANNGYFSRLFSDCKGEVLSLDVDPLAVEYNFLMQKKENGNIRPLVFDLVNPTPQIGWNNAERKNLINRSNNPDLTMALALIHHLRITYNIPLFKIRDYFLQISEYLIIEFVDKQDSQIQKMLMNRNDVFNDYNIKTFENIFCEKYSILNKTPINNTKRYLYLMRRRI